MAALACGGALDGVRVLLAGAALARATEEQCFGQDLVLAAPDALGPRLHARAATGLPLGPTPAARSATAAGAARSASPTPTRASRWAYVMNKMSPGTTGDTRGFELAMALYASL